MNELKNASQNKRQCGPVSTTAQSSLSPPWYSQAKCIAVLTSWSSCEHGGLVVPVQLTEMLKLPHSLLGCSQNQRPVFRQSCRSDLQSIQRQGAAINCHPRQNPTPASFTCQHDGVWTNSAAFFHHLPVATCAKKQSTRMCTRQEAVSLLLCAIMGSPAGACQREAGSLH